MSLSAESLPRTPRIAILADRARVKSQGPVWLTGGDRKTYEDAAREAGADVVWLTQNDKTPRELLEGVDGLLIPGGPDLNPGMYGQRPDHRVNLHTSGREYDRWQHDMTQTAMQMGMPIRGICRGMQVINVVQGGTLHQDIAQSRKEPPANPIDHVDGRHGITFDPGSTLANIFGVGQIQVSDGAPAVQQSPPKSANSGDVNTSHHQAVDRLGVGLVATAYADDRVMEALEMAGKPTVSGVQFHPERMGPEFRKPYFEHFVAHARAFQSTRVAVAADARPAASSDFDVKGHVARFREAMAAEVKMNGPRNNHGLAMMGQEAIKQLAWLVPAGPLHDFAACIENMLGDCFFSTSISGISDLALDAIERGTYQTPKDVADMFTKMLKVAVNENDSSYKWHADSQAVEKIGLPYLRNLSSGAARTWVDLTEALVKAPYLRESKMAVMNIGLAAVGEESRDDAHAVARVMNDMIETVNSKRDGKGTYRAERLAIGKCGMTWLNERFDDGQRAPISALLDAVREGSKYESTAVGSLRATLTAWPRGDTSSPALALLATQMMLRAEEGDRFNVARALGKALEPLSSNDNQRQAAAVLQSPRIERYALTIAPNVLNAWGNDAPVDRSILKQIGNA